MTVALPPLGTFAADLYTDLAPLAYDDPNQGYALGKLAGGMGAMFQQARDLGRTDSAGNPGWSLLLDIDRCPTAYLPYLGQYVGVQVDPSLNDVQQRDQIRAESAMARGGVSAIKAAAAKYLTGNQTVYLLPRTTSQWDYTVITYTSETPDEAAVLAALLAAKPARYIMTYTVVDGQTWAELIANYATWADVITAYTTWQDVINDTP